MAKLPQTPETYDVIFSSGGHRGIFDLPYWQSPYYPLNRAVLRVLRRHRTQSVLEVGCGTGAFAHMVFERTRLAYRGFDFSPVALARAAARTGRPDAFFQGDATKAASYAGEYDALVCTEVLEHIVDDRGAVAEWPTGCLCVSSVPNFDSDTHERFFVDEADVRRRYGDLLHIDGIFRVKKPVLPILTWRRYARAIAKSWRRPRLLLDVLGAAPFSRTGGWFVFYGRK
jgi:SAM-dependent methyltransferase